MNIWIRNLNENQEVSWFPSVPPSRLQMSLLNHGDNAAEHVLVLTKDVDGTCELILCVPGKSGRALAINELTELQARSFAVAYLEKNAALEQLSAALNAVDYDAVKQAVEELIASVEVEASGAPMFPEWLRGNFRSNPECMKRAAECLRMRRLSVGSGTKLIIADGASLYDSSQADIILSAQAVLSSRKSVSGVDIAINLAAKLGVVVLIGAGGYALVRGCSKLFKARSKHF